MEPMDALTRIFITRALQLILFIPVFLAARQLYRDVSDQCKPEEGGKDVN